MIHIIIFYQIQKIAIILAEATYFFVCNENIKISFGIIQTKKIIL